MMAAAALLTACGTSSGGGDTDAGPGEAIPLLFNVERDLLAGFEHDTGFVPESGPAGVRARASATAALVVDAEGTADAGSLTPIEGSGLLQVEAGLSFEISARVDATGVQWEGVVDTFEYGVDPSSTVFDPFLLDGSASVSTALPPAELASVPIGAVPGATLIVSVEGGSVETSFAGVCATVGDGTAQYTGVATVQGSVDLAATIEIEVPLLGSEAFGPFAVPVPIPASTMDLDLGSFSVADGAPVDASPCTAQGETSGSQGTTDTETQGGVDSDSPESDTAADDSTGGASGCDDTCTGCCLDGECLDGFDNGACGSNGACQVCEAGQTCDGLSCVDEPDCLATCEGCCVGSTCVAGFDQNACGFQAECEACDNDSTCDGVECVPADSDCLETCDGCCIGGVCNPGTDDDACGSFGACEDCGANAVCEASTCVPATWTISLLSGEILVDDLDAFNDPDPYLELSGNGPGLVFSQSETQGNTLEPVWDEVLGADVELTNPFVLEMWDEDSLSGDDLIGACTVSFPPSAFGGVHEVECAVGGAVAWTAVFAIDPS